MYPGLQEAAESDWLDNWFVSRTHARFIDSLTDQDQVLPQTAFEFISTSALTAPPAKLISLHAHYFRGFRKLNNSIRLDAELVVIDGRNSSGKTSLGEAIEWLLTGGLSRRESRDHGSSRELQNCIANQFRPPGDKTWVEATFQITTDSTSATLTLRRELVHDYGPTNTSECESKLFIDDAELSLEEESDQLERLFGSVPPLLMQHTLRYFVESTPDKRRQYFERLLRINQLTDLISRAVVGDTRLRQIRRPRGGAALEAWQALANVVDRRPINRTMRRNLRRSTEDIEVSVRQALKETARSAFFSQVAPSDDYNTVRIAVEEQQHRSRQRSFPPLESLRPRARLPDDASPPAYHIAASEAATELTDSWSTHAHARAALTDGNVDRIAIAQAFTHLLDAHVIDADARHQVCPLCNFQNTETLTSHRIRQIQQWIPLFDEERQALDAVSRAKSKLIRVLESLIDDYKNILPEVPTTTDLDPHLLQSPSELSEAVGELMTARQSASQALDHKIDAISSLARNPLANVSNARELHTMTADCLNILKRCESLYDHARIYSAAFSEVENAVGTAARRDSHYRIREAWLTCADDIAGISSDLKWEDAKLGTQRDLESMRDQLIDYRRAFLESRRSSFNVGMQAVWSELRDDRYSMFSELNIPEPRGRGFPVEIEVKALLDDSTETRSVDALQVFSESQVNALGIAAFITRSQLIGHRVLIFDDPVQSMDEEHFKTFARDVLRHLLDEEFQVVLLTHNDTFARDVSYWHFDRPEYVTMKVRHSRREGCIVEEGNRRVSERLKLAERFCDDGKVDDAWKPVRLAIERLYLVSCLKHRPGQIDPDSWARQGAEYRWNSGARDVIEGIVPGAGLRLKEILDLSSPGSHDAPTRGETDLRRSIAYVRSLLDALRIGGG